MNVDSARVAEARESRRALELRAEQLERVNAALAARQQAFLASTAEERRERAAAERKERDAAAERRLIERGREAHQELLEWRNDEWKRREEAVKIERRTHDEEIVALAIALAEI